MHEVVVQNGDVLCMDQITLFHNRLLDLSEKECETSNRNIKAQLLTLERSLNPLNNRLEKSQEGKIKECARMIRDQINAVEDLMDWPPSESQVTTEKIIIPGLFELLLRRIILSRGSHRPRVDRLVSSIAQDLIYNSTNGRSKTVKHVELALNI